MSVLIECVGISKRFGRPLDFAARLARRLGAEGSEDGILALDRVDLAVGTGEVVGLAGESGCGKSTLGRIVAGVLNPDAGRVLYRGRAYDELGRAERKAAALAVQMIFQNPFAALNPRLRVRDLVGEAAIYHGIVRRGEAPAHVAELMRRVGLDPAYRDRYPHQFSGGQRQRIGIARALAVKPALVVCDEAVAALDVSIQAQVLNVFIRLREELGLAYLFISHDLGVVEHICDRVAIMYLGRIVERAPTETLFATPNHPYTQGLIAEVPRLDQRGRRFAAVAGEIPSPLDPPPGCHFHPRCRHAMARCRVEAPALREIAAGHFAACHLNEGA